MCQQDIVSQAFSGSVILRGRKEARRGAGGGTDRSGGRARRQSLLPRVDAEQARQSA